MARKKKQVDLEAVKVLGTYDDLPIVESSIAITNAGDGLSKAMEVDPINIHMNDEVYVVLATTASQVKFKPHKDDAKKLIRTIVLTAGVATIVEAELVAAVLDAQQERIDKAAGVSRIPFDGGEEDED